MFKIVQGVIWTIDIRSLIQLVLTDPLWVILIGTRERALCHFMLLVCKLKEVLIGRNL